MMKCFIRIELRNIKNFIKIRQIDKALNGMVIAILNYQLSLVIPFR